MFVVTKARVAGRSSVSFCFHKHCRHWESWLSFNSPGTQFLKSWHTYVTQVRSRWKALPGTWMGRRTASFRLRSWTRVKTWPFPSPTISSTPHTTHTSQVRTAGLVAAAGWLHVLIIYSRMNGSLVHSKIQRCWHRIHTPCGSVSEMHRSIRDPPPPPYPIPVLPPI